MQGMFSFWYSDQICACPVHVFTGPEDNVFVYIFNIYV